MEACRVKAKCVSVYDYYSSVAKPARQFDHAVQI